MEYYQCIAQELLRLFDPDIQPKTRIAYYPGDEELSLLEEKQNHLTSLGEIKDDFLPIGEIKDFLPKVERGEITGVGRVAAAALIVGDIQR